VPYTRANLRIASSVSMLSAEFHTVELGKDPELHANPLKAPKMTLDEFTQWLEGTKNPNT
jgi:hypothetical protein